MNIPIKVLEPWIDQLFGKVSTLIKWLKWVRFLDYRCLWAVGQERGNGRQVVDRRKVIEPQVVVWIGQLYSVAFWSTGSSGVSRLCANIISLEVGFAFFTSGLRWTSFVQIGQKILQASECLARAKPDKVSGLLLSFSKVLFRLARPWLYLPRIKRLTRFWPNRSRREASPCWSPRTTLCTACRLCNLYSSLFGAISTFEWCPMVSNGFEVQAAASHGVHNAHSAECTAILSHFPELFAQIAVLIEALWPALCTGAGGRFGRSGTLFSAEWRAQSNGPVARRLVPAYIVFGLSNLKAENYEISATLLPIGDFRTVLVLSENTIIEQSSIFMTIVPKILLGQTTIPDLGGTAKSNGLVNENLALFATNLVIIWNSKLWFPIAGSKKTFSKNSLSHSEFEKWFSFFLWMCAQMPKFFCIIKRRLKSSACTV